MLRDEGVILGITSLLVGSSRTEDDTGDSVETSDTAMLVVKLIGVDSVAPEEATVDASGSVVCEAGPADRV